MFRAVIESLSPKPKHKLPTPQTSFIIPPNSASPIYVAARDGKADILAVLLQHNYSNADFNKRENHGFTALCVAALNGHLDCIELLEKKGANLEICTNNDRSPLYHACRNGHFEVAEYLINKGVNINKRNDQGTSPLCAATKGKRPEVVELLVQHGADIDLPDFEGRSPLYIATENNDIECALVLVEYGADLNMVDLEGYTPAYVATKFGYERILSLLIENGANINWLTAKGWSLALVAAIHGHTKCLDFLLAHGIDIEQYIQSSKQLELEASAEFSRSFAACCIQRGYRDYIRRLRKRVVAEAMQRQLAEAAHSRRLWVVCKVIELQARFRGRRVRNEILTAAKLFDDYLEVEMKTMAAEQLRLAVIAIQAAYRGGRVRKVLRDALIEYNHELAAAEEAQIQVALTVMDGEVKEVNEIASRDELQLNNIQFTSSAAANQLRLLSEHVKSLSKYAEDQHLRTKNYADTVLTYSDAQKQEHTAAEQVELKRLKGEILNVNSAVIVANELLQEQREFLELAEFVKLARNEHVQTSESLGDSRENRTLYREYANRALDVQQAQLLVVNLVADIYALSQQKLLVTDRLLTQCSKRLELLVSSNVPSPTSTADSTPPTHDMTSLY